MSDSESFSPQKTADGSFTFFSTEFDESFHSHFGARQESFLKFAVPTELAIKAHKSQKIAILDICYGLGYNTAAALQTIWEANPNCLVEILALELDSRVPMAAVKHNLFSQNWLPLITDVTAQLARKKQILTPKINAKLLIGDARKTIEQVVGCHFQADAIFLDPFSPPHCPQLWTIEFIQILAQCLRQDGCLATYSCAAAVRTALLQAGFVIGSTPPVGRKTPGTIATYLHQNPISKIDGDSQNLRQLDFSPENIYSTWTLSPWEQEHLQTRAAIPYRDPNLSDPASVIIARRFQEQQESPLEPTSRWRKRWEK